MSRDDAQRAFSAMGAGDARRDDLKKLTGDDLTFFESVVGSSNVIQDPDVLQEMNQDWLRHYKGNSSVALSPESTSQLSEIIKYCNAEKIAIVPQGGNTGLVGGGTPVFDEVIISTKKMNKIHSLDPILGVITCDAGCILQNLDQYLRSEGFVMPLDLGAKGSCHIGGNVATNAGGVRYVRYGSLRGNVLGMEAVLPDGTVLDALTSLRKDNTGYDLKQLLIGSEGTLGIITKLAILTPRLASSVHVALLGLESFQHVLRTLEMARSDLVDIISAVEFLDSQTMQLSTNYLHGVTRPMDTEYPFYMLIETSGSNSEHDNAKIEAFIEKVMDQDCVLDGVLASDQAQADNLWRLREGAAEALSKHGYTYKYDVSVPSDQMYGLVETMRDRLSAAEVFSKERSSSPNVVGYGHLGDGNLHLNIVTPEYDDEVFNQIEPFVFERVSEMKGSISAEHGVGRAKKQFLHMSKSDNLINIMRSFKDVLDPNGIMNPYKVFP